MSRDRYDDDRDRYDRRDSGRYNNRDRDRGSSGRDRRDRGGDRDRDRRSVSFEDRRFSRRDSREREREGTDDFSAYYRERFGSHSPEEYQNLRLSHFHNDIPPEEVKEILLREFDRLGTLDIKIVRHPQDNERLAYVNFQRRDSARQARKTCYGRLCRLLGRKLKMDPAGVIRDQDGKFLAAKSASERGSDRGHGMPRGAGGPRRGAGYDDPGPGPGMNRNYFGPPPGRNDFDDGYGGGGRGGFRGRGRGRGGIGQHPHFGAPPPMRGGRGGGRGGGGGGWTGALSEEVDRRLISLKQYIEDTSKEEAACRTLFVGNLPPDVRENEVRTLFDRYGDITNVEIKHPHEVPFAYSFVSFENLDCAMEAKYHETGREFHGAQLKIGFGKPRRSKVLWVGGLGPWTSADVMAQEFDRYGMIEKIEYDAGASTALVHFASIDAASDACRALRGFPLTRGHAIRVDFSPFGIPPPRVPLEGGGRQSKASRDSDESSDESEQKRKRKRSPSSDESDSEDERRRKMRSGPRTPSPGGSRQIGPPMGFMPDKFKPVMAIPAPVPPPTLEPPPEPPLCTLTAATLQELEAIRSPCWTGALVLKKSAYAIRLYKLSGDDDLIDSRMRDPMSGESVKLHVTQRLPFSANNLADRFSGTVVRSQLAFMIAVANTNVPAADLRLADSPSRPLKAFVHYLNEKSAAGVVGLAENAVLYAFPCCDLAKNLLRSVAPNITVLQTNPESCLLLILSRAPAPQTTVSPAAPVPPPAPAPAVVEVTAAPESTTAAAPAPTTIDNTGNTNGNNE